MYHDANVPGYHCRRPRLDGQILATHVRHKEGEIWIFGVEGGRRWACARAVSVVECVRLESDTGERAGNKSLLAEAEPAERRDFADATLV